jgi:hypothetical protein
MGAVLDSLQARGIQTQENSMNSDAVVIWSVLWHGRMAQNQQVYQHYRAQNKPVIIIEIGALYRGNTWKISVNNITSQGYYGHLTELDWDRPAKLKISLATQLGSKPNIIIAAQHDRSLQVAGVDMTDWVKNTINILRLNTDRPITIRPHPRCRLMLNNLPPGVSVESPKKLARQASRWEELRALMSRMAHDVMHAKEFSDGIGDASKRGNIAELFRHGRKSDTVWLWVTFFMIQLSIYTAFSWLPTMLTTEGLSPALAGMGLTAYNFGGVIGAVLCALAINK